MDLIIWSGRCHRWSGLSSRAPENKSASSCLFPHPHKPFCSWRRPSQAALAALPLTCGCSSEFWAILFAVHLLCAHYGTGHQAAAADIKSGIISTLTVHTLMEVIEQIVCPGGSRRRQWHPTPVLLPGKSHGRRSLVDCNPCGR